MSKSNEKEKNVESPIKRHNQCSICLNDVNNPAFADGCLHKFCFQCLVEWSKRSNQCPVCRTLFRNVIMNVQSDTKFEQIPIEAPSSAEVSAFNIIRDIIVSQHGRNATIRTRITQSDQNGNVQVTNGQEIIPLPLNDTITSQPILDAEAEFAQAVERLFNQIMAFNEPQIRSLMRPNPAQLTPPVLPNPVRFRELRARRRAQLYPRGRQRRENGNNQNRDDINNNNNNQERN